MSAEVVKEDEVFSFVSLQLESRDARKVLNMFESIQTLRLENQVMHGGRRLGSFPMRFTNLGHCELFTTVIA